MECTSIDVADSNAARAEIFQDHQYCSFSYIFCLHCFSGITEIYMFPSIYICTCVNGRCLQNFLSVIFVPTCKLTYIYSFLLVVLEKKNSTIDFLDLSAEHVAHTVHDHNVVVLPWYKNENIVL